MDTELTKLLDAFPDKPWKWENVISNPNMTIEYFDSHPDIFKKHLSSNYYSYRHYEKSLEHLSSNPNLTLDYILRNLNTHKVYSSIFNWSQISQNPGITLENIEKHPTLPWSWSYVAKNPNITTEFIIRNKSKFSEKTSGNKIVYNSFLGSGKNITLEDIEKYPDIFWSKYDISKNPNLTLDFVINYPSNGDDYRYKWYFDHIFRSPNIHFNDLMNHSDFVLKRIDHLKTGFALNPNLTVEIVYDNPFIYRETLDELYDMPTFMFGDNGDKTNNDNFVTYTNYFSNPGNNKNSTWDWKNICSNPVFTLKDLEIFRNEHNYFSNKFISCNPNLTAKDFINSCEKWDWKELSKNQFQCHPYFDKPVCYI